MSAQQTGRKKEVGDTSKETRKNKKKRLEITRKKEDREYVRELDRTLQTIRKKWNKGSNLNHRHDRKKCLNS